jgi:hypothetical protein
MPSIVGVLAIERHQASVLHQHATDSFIQDPLKLGNSDAQLRKLAT